MSPTDVWQNMPLIFVAIVIATALVLAVLRQNKSNKHSRPIPGPTGDWLVGSKASLQLPSKAQDAMRRWALEYGELFQIRVGWHNWVVVNSPQAMKEIFDKQSASTSSKVPAPIGHDVVTGGRRMFTMPYGPRWRRYRTITHQLLSPKMTQTFLPAQSLEIRQLISDLAHHSGHAIDPNEHLRRMSFSIMMTATYGRRISSWDHEDVHHMLKGRQILGKISRPGCFIEDEIPLLATLPHWLQPSRKKAAELAVPVHAAKMRLWNILRTQQSGDIAPECFGKELLKQDLEAQGLADEDAAWIASGLVEVGSETTAITLANLILYLAAHPKCQDKAIAELDDVVGDGRLPCFEDVSRLPYVRGCVKEVLRLQPIPTWGLKHYTDHDVVYKDYIIPAGTVVVGNTWALHYNPLRYPDPEIFHPERFLLHDRSAAEYAAMADPLQRDHYAFGAGRRICPGSRLAENTLNLALAQILWCFHVRPPVAAEGMGLGSDAWEESAFRPPKPFKVRMVPRSERRMEVVLNGSWDGAKGDGCAGG